MMQRSWDSYDEALAAALEQGGPVGVSGVRAKDGSPRYVVTPLDVTDAEMWAIALEVRLGRELTPDEQIAASLMPAGVKA